MTWGIPDVKGQGVGYTEEYSSSSLDMDLLNRAWQRILAISGRASTEPIETELDKAEEEEVSAFCDQIERINHLHQAALTLDETVQTLDEKIETAQRLRQYHKEETEHYGLKIRKLYMERILEKP